MDKTRFNCFLFYTDQHKLVCHDSQPHNVITYALPTLKEPAVVNPTEGYRVVTSGPIDGVQRVEQRNVAIPGNVQINIRAMEGVEVNIRVPRGAKVKVEMEE